MRRQAPARSHRRGPPASSANTSPANRRFIDEVPAELIGGSCRRFRGPAIGAIFRTTSSGPTPSRGRGNRTREETPVYAYEDEDQSTGMALRPGLRVRHAQFGVGQVISVEPLDDDTKLVVRFNAVGVKTLRAKFARLEPA